MHASFSVFTALVNAFVIHGVFVLFVLMLIVSYAVCSSHAAAGSVYIDCCCNTVYTHV